MDAQPKAGTDYVELVRTWILVVLVLGLLGTVTELILLEHYEQLVQLIPVTLIAIAIAVLVWYALRRDTASLRALQIVMALFVLASFAGVAAHFAGSAEFALEQEPEIGTWDLVQKVLHAKAPPLLAPGMMMQLGLLGLAYAYSDIRYRRSKTP